MTRGILVFSQLVENENIKGRIIVSPTKKKGERPMRMTNTRIIFFECDRVCSRNTFYELDTVLVQNSFPVAQSIHEHDSVYSCIIFYKFHECF